MFRALIAKDLRRAWRNPVPWLINLALPLCITALVGLVFGGKSDTGLGRIRFAVVDEDDTVLTRMLRGALNQGKASEHLEPVFLERAEALRQVNGDLLSAALIIPTNFTRHYLNGAAAVKLELVKNPAQSIYPTVLEELMGVVVTALNAVARNFQPEFPAWRTAFEGELDYHKLAAVLESTGHKFDAAKRYLHPPLAVYERGEVETSETPNEQNGLSRDAAAASTNAEKSSGVVQTASPAAVARVKAPAKKSEPASAVFAYLLPGMAGMFLLFLAGNAMSDLLRELRFRTFERYQTLRRHLLPFVLGKVLFALVLLLFSSAILLGGGGVAFRVHWEQPWALAALSFGYACFATALMSLFVALLPDERRAAALTNIVGMVLAIAGGCMFPSHQLPAFLREHVTPLLPSAWFVEAARALQFGGGHSLAAVLLKFAVTSAVLITAAVLVFGRRFRSGAKP